MLRKHLGYILQKMERMEKQITERCKKAIVTMKKTWTIGEKLFKNDFRRRMRMFAALVAV